MTISSLRTAIVYENFIFTQEYTFAERYCFLTFLFEEKFRKYDISVKRKHTKTNENIIFSVLFSNFRKTKIFIFMQCNLTRFYILSTRSFPKREGLSDARIAWITNKEYSFAIHFIVKIQRDFKVNIWWMIKYDLLKLTFVWNFHN